MICFLRPKHGCCQTALSGCDLIVEAVFEDVAVKADVTAKVQAHCPDAVIPYINEGIRMVKEGVAPALIENAAKLVGMPLGPLQLTDETSIDLGVKIAKATKAAMGDAYDDAQDEVLFWLFEEGRLGRKSGSGFYTYDAKGKRTGLWDGLVAKYPTADTQPDLIEVQHRLLFAQVLEAVRALEENVLEDIREGDVGAILGWGFAPWSGGPFSWLRLQIIR